LVGLALLSLALSGATCDGQAAPGAGQDFKCVTCECTGITFVWAIERDDLIGMLKSSSPGWVAVGFSSDGSVSTGKIIIGSVVNNQSVVKLNKFFGYKLIPDTRKLIEAHAARERGVTVIVFRAKLRDLGLEGKISQTIPVILAKNATQENIDNYQDGSIKQVNITL
jgi:hypothetical protein